MSAGRKYVTVVNCSKVLDVPGGPIEVFTVGGQDVNIPFPERDQAGISVSLDEANTLLRLYGPPNHGAVRKFDGGLRALDRQDVNVMGVISKAIRAEEAGEEVSEEAGEEVSEEVSEEAGEGE